MLMRNRWLAIVLALPAYSAAAQKPFIECSREELTRAVPELAGIQFDSSQERLAGIQKASGEKLRDMLAGLVDVSAAEDINELRFDQDLSVSARRETFRYSIKTNPARMQRPFDEARLDAAKGTPVPPALSSDFLVLSYFYQLLDYLLPENRDESQFRYLGRLETGDKHLFVIAFAQRADSALPSHIAISATGETAPMQGLVWIDAATSEVVRARFDLLGAVKDFPFETVTTDISLAPVTFRSIDAKVWLPYSATIHAMFAAGEFHSVHRYSDYTAANERGTAAASPRADDSFELTASGISLLNSGNTAGAMQQLRQALRTNPEFLAAHFQLANALLKSDDTAGAEAELREAVKEAPASVVVHNLLGIVLGKRGDVAGAAAEFRICAEMLPKEPNLRFNLAQALERSGDRAGALAEYRVATELAPENAAFKARLDQFEMASSVAPKTETNIRVDVRQVLVPVIVTDQDGHHVTGLKREDFRVFEDGVEQKISAFSVEDSGLEGASAASGLGLANSSAERPEAFSAKKPQIRQTYLMVIDSLHSAATNLMIFRNSLLKFFRPERAADSQYILVALGTSLQILQDTTADPEKILKAIESKQFEKVFLDSRKAAANYDLAAFRRRLEQIRDACDHKQPECSERRSLDSEARELASEDRLYNKEFLSQFQSLVQQFARAPGRRSIVLISDGFPLVAGKETLDLLTAYFPEFRTAAMEALERTPDLDPVLRSAANSNIPIYTIDSRGLYTSPFFDASNGRVNRAVASAVMTAMDSSASAASDTLVEIAAATGGTAFRNSNDILNGLERVFADGRQYYVLVYVSTNSATDGKFRAISVRLRDTKMVVKAKRGYWPEPN